MNQLEFLELVKTVTIMAMSSDDRLMEEFVLKGGNALDIAYGASNRASSDLDFSMGDDFEPPDSLRERIANALDRSFKEHGFTVFDLTMKCVPPGLTDDMKDFWGGYKVEFKLASVETHKKYSNDIEQLRRHSEAIGDNRSTKFKIDISKHECTDGKQQMNLKGLQVFVYSPAMIVAEKLRAICQQMPEYAGVIKRTRPSSARARDFVDICVLCEKLGVDVGSESFKASLVRAFAIKKVPLHLIGEIRRYRNFHEPDFVSVRDTVKPGVTLKDFDYYFDIVTDKCRQLEPLWNMDSPS